LPTYKGLPSKFLNIYIPGSSGTFLKYSFFIFLIFIFSFVFKLKANASSPFIINVKATYDFTNRDYTLIRINNFVTNTTQEVVLDNQIIDTGFDDVFDIGITTNTKGLTANVTLNSSRKEIDIKFTNSIVGKDNLFEYIVFFKTRKALKIEGQVYEINIPKVEKINEFASYNLEILTPLSWGMPNFSSPISRKVVKNTSYILTTFNSNEIFNSPIKLGFGDYQIFDVSLKYKLVNNTAFTKNDQILLIPQKEPYQEYYVKKLEPTPLKILKDEDGNLLAEYAISKNSSLNILLEGSVKVFFRKIDLKSGGLISNMPKDLILKYTKPDIYWESDQEEIKTQALKLKSSTGSVVESAFNTYNFVVNTLNYNLNEQNPQRKGAILTLTKERNGVCMEFTDLTIALLRSMGIPARELEGYAMDPLGNKLESLHSWLEFYDPILKWVPIDPTWGNTSKIDYFNNFDIKRIVFLTKGISSTKPYINGLFDLDNKNSININFSNSNEINYEKSVVNMITTEEISKSTNFTKLETAFGTLAILFLCVSGGFLLFHLKDPHK